MFKKCIFWISCIFGTVLCFFLLYALCKNDLNFLERIEQKGGILTEYFSYLKLLAVGLCLAGALVFTILPFSNSKLPDVWKLILIFGITLLIEFPMFLFLLNMGDW